MISRGVRIVFACRRAKYSRGCGWKKATRDDESTRQVSDVVTVKGFMIFFLVGVDVDQMQDIAVEEVDMTQNATTNLIQ